MDFQDKDCCDAAVSKDIYKKVTALHTGACEIDTKLRIKADYILREIDKKN